MIGSTQSVSQPRGRVARAELLRALGHVLAGLFLLLVAMYAAAAHWWMFRTLQFLHYNDFGKFYYSLIQWQGGGSMYGPSPATPVLLAEGPSQQLWNMNPPHFHFLLLPLSGLSIEWAHVVWTLLNLAVLLVSVRVIILELDFRPGIRAWLAIVVLAAASEPALSWSVTGQLTGLLVGAVSFIWMSVRRERWRRAGVMLGIACSIKPFLGVLGFYFLLQRKWTPALISIASFLAAFLAGWVVFGSAPHREWFEALGEAHWVGAVMNASMHAVVARARTTDVYATGSTPELLGGLLVIALVGVSVLAMRRAGDHDRALFIALTASLLASPLGWVYYLPIVAGPLIALATRGELGRAWWILLAGFLVPHFLLYPFPSRLFAITVGSIYVWGLIALWVLAARTPLSIDVHSGGASRQKWR